MKSFKYNLLKFFAEFILIVTGIILSFYIQDKIEDRASKKEARHIMQQVLSDLVNDTLLFNQGIKVSQSTISSSDYLLNINYETQLDTEEELDSFFFCFWYTTTNLKTPIHMAGYTRLIYFDNNNIIHNDSLINYIIGYYTIDKAIMDGCMKFDADFVDGPLTEAYTESYSYNILNAAHKAKPYPETMKEDIILFLENKKIRSLLLYNISNKAYYREHIQATKDSASKKIELLKNWLAKF